MGLFAVNPRVYLVLLLLFLLALLRRLWKQWRVRRAVARARRRAERLP
jgi:hypothetical protein